MGVETNVYVGAYLKVEKVPKKEKEITYRQCGGCDYTEKNFGDSKFCKYCGAKIETRTVRTKEKITVSDILDDDESLFEIEYSDILIPNKRTKAGIQVFCGDTTIEKLPETNCAEIFAKDFKKQIEKIEKSGAKCSIKSGIITYFS
jgi:hypothetical protein